jgi:arginase
LKRGLVDHLRSQNHEVEEVAVRLPKNFFVEGQALVELQTQAVAAVRAALAQARRPLILSGNCGPAALSAVSALGHRGTGVVWFDAHADFNTPETSASAFLDGMALSILTGRSWPALAARFDGFDPIAEQNVLLVGARDFDKAEAAALGKSAITHLAARAVDQLPALVGALATRVERLYLHLDIDVLDKSEGAPNGYASGGGLAKEELWEALQMIARCAPLSVAGITAYDPTCDGDGRVSAVIERAISILAA